MTTEDTPIDFAEDGRLLAFRRICGDLEDESVWSFTTNIMALRARLEPAVSEAETVTAAYREVVLAAKELCRRADEREAVPLGQKGPPISRTIEARERLDDALARFRNITETP